MSRTKKGFTIIEVSIFLAITGLLLVGVLGGTYSNIARQRYNDSVRSFAEFFRQTYSEVISPETLGLGNSNDTAIYGKVLVFGLNSPENDEDNLVYTATLVGDVHIPNSASDFIDELGRVDARLFCGIDATATGGGEVASTLDTYTPLWGAEVYNTQNKRFTGTVIIARSPTSGTVHTAFYPETFDLKGSCSPGSASASTRFNEAIEKEPNKFTTKEINFCLKSDNSRVVRNIRISADGRNTSAVSIVPDSEDSCQF